MSDRLNREHRETRRDRCQLLVGGVRVEALEELAYLPGPLAQVLPQHRSLLVIAQLDGGERLDPPANPKLAGAGCPQVAHPLGDAARGDQVALAVQRQWFDRR